MKATPIFFALCLAFFCWNCESDEQQTADATVTTTEDATDDEINIEINSKEDVFDAMHTILDKMEKEIDQKSDRTTTASTKMDISYEDLQTELPLMVNGMLRQDVTGDRNGVGKFQVANAKATYRTDGRLVELGITYVGGIPLAGFGEKILKDANIVHEEEGEKAKTTTIGGFTAFEAYNDRKKSGSVAVFIDDRFIVYAKGEGLSEKALRKAVEKVDMKGLANW